MDLEKRIIALEDELKVLKGEVQQVLLEIKEYLLEARYPELSGSLRNGGEFPGTEAKLQTLGREDGGIEDAQSHAVARPVKGSLTTDGKGHPNPGADVDLMPLIQWAKEAVRRLGREPTQQVLEMWAQSQHLPETWVRMLRTFVEMAPEPEEAPQATLEDITFALMELQRLTRSDRSREPARQGNRRSSPGPEDMWRGL